MKLPWRRAARSGRSADEPQTIVIGLELAAARTQEAKVRAANPGAHSPLDRRYDIWKGEMDLARFVESPLDDDVRAVVADFWNAEGESRTATRTALTMDDFYTVLDFSRRASLASLRQTDPELAVDALRSIALVDIERVDWRDVPSALELAAYSVVETGGDLPAELERLQAVSVPGLGPGIARLQGPSAHPSPSSAGYVLVSTSYGLGLLSSWAAHLDPTVVAPVMIGLADAIDEDADYLASPRGLGMGIPTVWFSPATRERVEHLTASAAATGDVAANRRHGPNADDQMFVVFVADMGSADHAAELVDLAASGPRVTEAALALARGTIFVLTIARSMMVGVASVETSESLERFRHPFTAALEAAASR